MKTELDTTRTMTTQEIAAERSANWRRSFWPGSRRKMSGCSGGGDTEDGFPRGS